MPNRCLLPAMPLLAGFLLAAASAGAEPASRVGDTPAPTVAAGPPAKRADAAKVEAQAFYDLGRRAYDNGDYRAALQAYSQGAILEPERARWQFQLGLTLRRLGHLRAARDAFLAAGRLDPDYKRVEIAQNLRAMGLDGKNAGRPVSVRDDEPPDTRLPTLAAAVAAALLLTGGGIFYLRRRRRMRDDAAEVAPLRHPEPSILPDNPAATDAQCTRLMRLGARLVGAEHALRAGEDPELRIRLDRATALEHDARQQLAAVSGGRGLALAAATTLLDEAEAIADEIDALAGDRGGTTPGSAPQRIACWFCARPLANAAYLRIVPLLTGDEPVEVLACPPCAARVDHGEAPDTLVLGDASRQLHWSENPAYDPYLHRHAPPPQAHLIPIGQFIARRPLAELARLAAGGAAAANAVFAVAREQAVTQGATHGLDLDATRAAALAGGASSGAAGAAKGGGLPGYP